MATYFHGNSEIQAGPSADNGLQTLFLMNPTYAAGFSSDSRPSSNNFFLSPPINPHTPPPSHTQQFVGIPIPTNNSGFFHEIPVPHRVIPGSTETLWTPITRHDEEGELETPRTQRGLSLSLSDMKQQTVGGGEERKPSGMLLSPASSGEQVAGIIQNSVLISSKYLRAAQQLLEECVNVENGGGSSNKSEGGSKKMSGSKEAGESSEGGDGDAAAEHSGGETSVAERQEIQMKKAKLVVVLDEVEQRYRQYHHQMQVVVSSYEQSAGIDSAKAYTALALKTISKQFRCLKDAILDQIGVANKSLGEEDGLAERFEGSRLKFVDSRLTQQRAIQQLGIIQNNAWRPQRGLPERSVSVLRAWLFEHFLNPYPKNSDKHMLAKQTGLSRSQVSNWFINARVRLWKPMVEEMYREEVKEQEQNNASDIKASTNERDNEDSTSKSQEKIHFTVIPSKSFTTKNHLEIPSSSTATLISTPPMAAGSNCRNRGSFSLTGSSDLEGIAQSSAKRQRIETEMLHFTNGLSSISMDLQPNNEANNEHVLMTFGIEKQGRDGYPMIGGGQANFTGGYDSFSIEEMGRFDAEQFQQSFAGSGVSLTLGLPDRENFSMSGGGHQSFLRGQNIQLDRRMEMGETNDFGSLHNETPQHSATAYDIQKQKRFVAQLLPDFVA